MWNAGQRDDMNSFVILACLGPFYPEETAGSRKLILLLVRWGS